MTVGTTSTRTLETIATIMMASFVLLLAGQTFLCTQVTNLKQLMV
ncbi:hypothetical protein ACT7DH_24770 [Bacillus pacificus]